MIKTKQGLDLPIAGRPEQVIHDGSKVRSVAIIGFDYIGMKPTMHVKVGDRVRTGEIIFSDKKNDGVRFTAPATGVIAAINRGEQRVLQSVVIDVEPDEFVEFKTYPASEIATLDREKVQTELVHSGLWTAFRTRPFSKTPHINSAPRSIFVTAMDTHPLAADPALIIAEHKTDFALGVTALTRLTDGKVFVCKAAGSSIQLPEMPSVSVNEFAGPHPAGLAGTHIHFLDPVGAKKTVWTIGYQDVIAIGKLFSTGKLWTERVISLAGPQVEKPRLVRTRIGANLEELTAGQMKAGENRIISGSVLGGRKVRGAMAFLGRFHNQVSVLLEGREREFMHYMRAGTNKFSTLGIYISQFAKNKLFNFDTSTNGSERAMVPVGSYEKVMPLDILPTQLLRYILVGDTDMAQKLGALELDEEDLALCTYVCPGKYEYGPVLRDTLTRIEKEG